MLGPARIRIGVMPGAWPDGPGAAERFVAGGGTMLVLWPAGPPAITLDQFARLAPEVIPAFHAR